MKYFTDDHVTSQVNDRAKLVVGAMVSTVTKCNETWASHVTRLLEERVGIHGKQFIVPPIPVSVI